MKKQRLSEFLSILAMMLPIFLAAEASGAEIRITRANRNTVEVAGGTGDAAWHIRYGSFNPSFGPASSPITLAGPAHTAYFSHANWLRQIDAEKGVVTGRWRFPGMLISALSWKGEHVQVEIEDQAPGNRSFHRVVDFNPDNPSIPYWPAASLFTSSAPEGEMVCCRRPNPKMEEAQEWLAEAENAARRDPLSPWLRVQLARIYQVLGRPEAAQVFNSISAMSSTDFGELLRLSDAMERDNQTEIARETFERGYQEYWQRGNDPRLVSSLLARISFYPGRSGIENTYKLGPWVQAAEFAWESQARSLERRGDSGQAREWHRRAQEAREKSLYSFNSTLSRWLLALTILLGSSLIAAPLYFIILFLRYLPQRRIQVRADRQEGRTRRFRLFNIEYWSRQDRITFLTIAIAAWLTLGLVAAFVDVVLRVSTVPLAATTGSFAGPVTIDYFEKNLPASPERDLLLAMAYHHDGQLDKAEALYRRLPQFAESWNNLGAALKDSGKIPEARQAFEQARRLDGQMAEVRLNLDNESPDFWTDLHRKYLPQQAMLAPPSRGHVLQAFGLGAPPQLVLQALQGPILAASRMDSYRRLSNRGTRQPLMFVGIATLVTLVLVFALAVLLFMPARDVTQPPYRSQSVADYLIPGTAAEWQGWGGIILSAWTFLAVGSLAYQTRGFLLFVGTPNIERSFGVPAGGAAARVLQPDVVYIYLSLALLYLVNAGFVGYRRRSPGHRSWPASPGPRS